MNELQRRLMSAPSIESVCCPFCGRPWTERHHIVPRSVGGSKGPTVTVCGFGNTSGCHGLLHQHRLHLDYSTEDGWVLLKTDEPMRYSEAIRQLGWRKLHIWEDWGQI